MKLFLTSSAVDCQRDGDFVKDVFVRKENGFCDLLKADSLFAKTFVYVASDFDNFEKNDNRFFSYYEAFKKVGFVFERGFIIDNRSLDVIDEILAQADILFFAGGDVVLQNQNFKKIRLKEKLNSNLVKENLVIVGQSAGSMNCAKEVYNYPENEEEKNWLNFFEGLGLTDINIVPHFNEKTGNELLVGNIDLINDYFVPDSYKSKLFALKDGSFVKINGNKKTIFGECFLFENGKSKKICCNKESKEIL